MQNILYRLSSNLNPVFYLNIDKILINIYLGKADAGIYKAYIVSFLSILTLSIGIFIAVFFPVASKSENKKTILRKINKIIPIMIGLGLPVMIGFGSIIFQNLGENLNANSLWFVKVFVQASVCFSKCDS